MAKCTIDISNTGSIEELLEKAEKKITSDKGGSFDGNSEKGNYTIPTSLGKIKGTYEVKEKSIHLEITDKPMFIGCDKIEDKLKEYLTSESD